jgi:hypothetical protein
MLTCKIGVITMIKSVIFSTKLRLERLMKNDYDYINRKI